MIMKIPDDYYDDGKGNMIPKWEFRYSMVSAITVAGLMITGLIGAIVGNQILMQGSLLMAILLMLIKIEFNQS